MFVSLTDLWMPIVLSSVFAFIASSIIWMALPIHKADYSKLPDEDKMLQAIREQKLEGGMYVYPMCKPQDMKNPEMLAKHKAGPWGYIIASSSPPNMGLSLGMKVDGWPPQGWDPNNPIKPAGPAAVAATAAAAAAAAAAGAAGSAANRSNGTPQ